MRPYVLLLPRNSLRQWDILVIDVRQQAGLSLHFDYLDVAQSRSPQEISLFGTGAGSGRLVNATATTWTPISIAGSTSPQPRPHTTTFTAQKPRTGNPHISAIFNGCWCVLATSTLLPSRPNHSLPLFWTLAKAFVLQYHLWGGAWYPTGYHVRRC